MSAWYWTDLKETRRRVPGTWKWSNGKGLAYHHKWARGNPNLKSETRAAIKKSDGSMHDREPGNRHHFICERGNQKTRTHREFMTPL